jgi:hypothetical protein
MWYRADTHRFSWGGEEDPQAGTPADYYSNENRIINFVARALGHLDANEFALSLAALEAPPGAYGRHTVHKMAWDGSYFTYASPALFIREVETLYGPWTIFPATRAQIAYASAQGYDGWGLSDCFDVGAGGYMQQGAPPTAAPGSPETRPGLLTPHASAMALITPLASQALSNLQTISTTLGAYDAKYGFYDSVMANPSAPDYGQHSERFSALAQEWLLLSIVNHQTGFVWDNFYLHSGVREAHKEMYPKHSTHFLPLAIAD